MGEAFITRRGGTGGSGGPTSSDAILTVTVPTGSTVTMTKGGVTLTPTMWVQAADPTLDCALFVIPAAQFDSTTPWTVTATLGTGSATANVLIDSNKQYDVELSYTYYLYNKGTQFPDRPGGGWDANRDSSTVFQSDHIHLYGGTFPFLSTVNTLSFAGWTNVVFRITAATFGTGTNSGIVLFIGTTKYSAASGSTPILAREKTTGEARLPLSSVQTGTYYIEAYVYTSGESCDIDQIWLE